MTGFATDGPDDWNREAIFTRTVARRDHELLALRAGAADVRVDPRDRA